MADNKYTVRGVADMTQHDSAIKKSASEVYKYKKQVEGTKEGIKNFTGKITGLVGGLGKLVPAIGLATGGLEIFKKLMRSTESSSDALDRTIYTLKSSVDKFFQSVMTGDLSGFITDLKEIAKNASAAYDSLDKLGTDKMWKNARIAQAQARIDYLRANGGSKEEIEQWQKIIDSLQKGLTTSTYNTAHDVLGGIMGKRFTNKEQEEFLRMWEDGTLKNYLENFKKTHSTTTAMPFAGGLTKPLTEWDNLKNEEIYNALNRLLNVTEKGALEQVYQLIEESARNSSEASRKKMRNTGGSTSTSTKTTTSTSTKTQRNNDKIGWISNRKYIESVFNSINDLTKVEPVLDEFGDIVYEKMEMPLERVGVSLDDVIEKSKQYAHENVEIIESEAEHAERLANIFDLQLQSINSLGSALSDLGNTFDNTGLKAAGIIAQAIATLIEGYAKSMASFKATSSPWAWIGFSVAGLATLTSVISQIHSLSGYASGGIIQGANTIGDYNLARVNSGEMILNGTQQARLFNLLNGSSVFNGSSNNNSGQVEFKIKGQELVGVLNNYNKKIGRVI